MMSALMAAAAQAAEQEWNAGYLNVLQGNVVNLSKNYCTNTYVGTTAGTAVILHGDMNVTAKKYFAYVVNDSGVPQSKSVYIDLGGAAGDTGRLAIDGCAMSTYVNNGLRGQVRDYAARESDKAAVSLANGSSMRISSYTVTGSATSGGDYLTSLDLGARSYVNVSTFYNQSAKDAKILFSGADAWISSWSYGATLFACETKGGGSIVLEGAQGEPIIIKSWPDGGSTQSLLTSSSVNDLVFQGDCDVRLVSERSAKNNKTPIVINHANIRFRQKGDLVCLGGTYGACTTLVSVVNVLPSGQSVGNVRVESVAGKTPHVLNLQGNSQAINGLDLQGGSVVASSTGASTLTFGTGDSDGVLNGTIDDANITLVKVGTGTLSVTNTTTLRQLDLQAGTLLVDGVTLTCPALAQAAAARIVCVNGGKVVAPGITAEWRVADGLGALDATYPSGQSVSLEHATPGLGTLLTGGTFADVDVSAGTLRVGGDPVLDKYWRFVFREANAAYISTNKDATLPKRWVALALNRIHLFSPVGDVTDLNLSLATSGTAASDLAAGKITTSLEPCRSDGVSSGQGGHYKDASFLTFGLTDNWFNGVAWDAPAVSPDDESTWITVTMRLKDAAAVATGYNLDRAVNSGVTGVPLQWTVQSSTDGVTWTERDVRSVPKTEVKGPQTYANSGTNYLFRAGKAAWSFAPTGTVKIATGAVLDLNELSAANISLRNVEIDLTAGAGKVTQFVPAADGAVYLTNVPPSMLTPDGGLAHRTILPLTFDTASSADRLSTWKVFVNGQVTGSRLSVAGGRLVASGTNGMVLIFR